jgi:hypothetical protein
MTLTRMMTAPFITETLSANKVWWRTGKDIVAFQSSNFGGNNPPILKQFPKNPV